MDERLDTIVDLLTELPQDIANAIEEKDDIAEKLDRIIDLLNQQQIALEKYYEDSADYCKPQFYNSINDIDFSELSSLKSCVLLGYKKKAIIDYYSRTIEPNKLRFSDGVIETSGDLAATLTNCSEGTYLVIDADSVLFDKNITQLLSDAIARDVLGVFLGKGSSRKSICLDLPTIHYVFYATTDLSIPNKILKEVDECFTSIEVDSK